MIEDMIFFGSDRGETSSTNRENQMLFVEQVLKIFPDFKLYNAISDKYGYCYSITFAENRKTDYIKFLYDNMWYTGSLLIKMTTIHENN